MTEVEIKTARDYLKDDIYLVYFYLVVLFTHKMSYNYIVYSFEFSVFILFRCVLGGIILLIYPKYGWLLAFYFTGLTIYEHYKRKELKSVVKWSKDLIYY